VRWSPWFVWIRAFGTVPISKGSISRALGLHLPVQLQSAALRRDCDETCRQVFREVSSEFFGAPTRVRGMPILLGKVSSGCLGRGREPSSLDATVSGLACRLHCRDLKLFLNKFTNPHSLPAIRPDTRCRIDLRPPASRARASGHQARILRLHQQGGHPGRRVLRPGFLGPLH
jgi:hypothetical protein